jgi:hypothetical protein
MNKKIQANFFYELDEDDLRKYSFLSIHERLLWLESIFELTLLAETSRDYKIRQFFRQDLV